MNVERLNHLLRRCGKTKAQIADECRISKVTLDNALHGGDIRVSTLEAIAASVGVWPGVLFDDPAGFVSQTGGQNNVHGDLTPYFARHTWATLAASLDVPMDTISEALGHAHGSRVTGIYVRFAREKVDAANRRVLDFLNGV